jgi:hypothetical protein
MVSSVGSRPNHYQTLGLTPAASDDEIKQAFTTKMGLFGAHPLGEAAQLCIAYETLRNPAKRRDYDRALGLTPVPEGRQWGFGLAQKKWRPFIAAGPLDDVIPQARADARSEPHVTAEPQREAPEPRIASFIAESLRELARPMAVEESAGPARPPQVREVQPEPTPEPEVETRIEQILAAPQAEEDSFGSVEEERGFDLKRPALAVGGFILAAGLIGTMSGLSLKDDVESASAAPEPALTIPVPAPKAGTAASAAPTPGATAQTTQPDQPVAAYSYAPRSRHSSSHKLTSWARQQVQSDSGVEEASAQAQPAEVANADLSTDPLAPKPVEATMPLPSKVIARTIERIGYSCGEVSSTSAVEGSQGSYKVTCSSGQTYQATPVHGRYRFKRSGSR